MRWIGSVVVIGLVAVPARPVGDVVIAELGGVTLRALYRGMGAGERETGNAVVKRSNVLPARRRVAGFTCGRQVRGLMIRIRGLGVILQVATRTRRGRPGKFPPNMALRAGHVGMRAGQSKARRVVIKSRSQKRRRRVTQRAVLREIGGDVIRSLRRHVSVHVAADARRGRTCVPVPHVALLAL